MSSEISNQRKAVYYIGLGTIVFGFILFMSSFFGGMEPSFSMETPAFFKRGVFGMIFMVVGSVLTVIGRSGAAGSGLLLDPDKQREDLKPFNEAQGKMINDVIENIDIVKNIMPSSKENIEVIKIRCRECGELNDEDAKFCKKCGKMI
jgi:predicted Zn-ribbon and HTH transcriptional regulator